MSSENDVMSQLENYRKVVLAYENLKSAIDRLLSQHDGSTENMSPEDLARYRKLAQQRDEAHNDMRVMEQMLLDEDTRH
jgi:hypothetical protein